MHAHYPRDVCTPVCLGSLQSVKDAARWHQLLRLPEHDVVATVVVVVVIAALGSVVLDNNKHGEPVSSSTLHRELIHRDLLNQITYYNCHGGKTHSKQQQQLLGNAQR